jgi:type II secretory pathway pseudopilin PulG
MSRFGRLPGVIRSTNLWQKQMGDLLFSSISSDLSGGPPVYPHSRSDSSMSGTSWLDAEKSGSPGMVGGGWDSPPFLCMYSLVSDNPSNLTPEQQKAAFDAWVNVTGYSSPDYVSVFNSLSDQQQMIVNFDSYYMYAPVLLLSLIVIWLAVWFGWMNWVVGLFLSVLSVVILYGFSVLYRTTAKTWLRQQNQAYLSVAEQMQQNYENSIAYWPQGLFAVSCAVTSAGGTGNPPGNGGSNDCWKNGGKKCSVFITPSTQYRLRRSQQGKPNDHRI